MDLKELQKDPKMMEIMKEIGNIMQMRSKQEQAEKVKNFRILNENAVKGQILDGTISHHRDCPESWH